jgi:hypothetical protein
MDLKQKKIVFGITMIVVVLWLGSPLLGRREEALKPSAPLSLLFDPSRALQTTQDFVITYPRRVLGSIEARQSTGYLQHHFERLGYQVTYSHFDAMIAGRRQVGRNVYAFRSSASQEILALVAHYDTTRTTLHGAMDNGSGIGALLELARVFAAKPVRRSILLVASDGEEWGMLGALDFARHYPERDRIIAAVSLDYVAAGDLAGLTLDSSGQMGGYAPPWLRILARTAAEAEGLTVSEPAGFREFLERALLLSWTDQGPLLNAGIPAINLGSESNSRAAELSIYHSSEDTPGNLRVESFAKFGNTAERIVRTIDSLPAVPREAMGTFRVHGNLMLAPSIMAVMQGLAFLPLLAALWFHAANHGRHFSPGRIRRELSSFLGTILPFFLVYPAVMLLTLLRRLPLFSFYPATPKDPILEHPQYGVIVGILAAVFLAGIGGYFLIRFLNSHLPRPEFNVSKTVLLAILSVVVAGALFYNAYWAVSFLTLPAWIWALVGPGRGPGGRAANRVMILTAGVLYYALSCSYAARLCVGWKLFWYEILALSTGMFRGQAFLLSMAMFALAIRFLAIQSHGRED